MDFMIFAMDSIVNQAAKWSHMLGGQANPGLTIRSIINRGGEQGAQHSQALHAWFAHVPGLRVVMPSTVADARDLLIASVLSPDPVMYIDDRWLYDQEAELKPVVELDLSIQKPLITKSGKDITIVSSGHTSMLARNAAASLLTKNISCEVIDLRVLNPFFADDIILSVKKTRNLLVVDSGTMTGSFSGEVISKVVENIPIGCLKNQPKRLALPDAPAPTSRALENSYYLKENDIEDAVTNMLYK
jgi:pyruvate dehydrogenase E1 component beta subunit